METRTTEPRSGPAVIVESRDEWALASLEALDRTAQRIVVLSAALDGLLFAVLAVAGPEATVRTSLFVRWLTGVTVVIALAALLIALDALTPLRFDLIARSQDSDWPFAMISSEARKHLIRYKSGRVRLATLFFMLTAFTFTLVLLLSLLWLPQ